MTIAEPRQFQRAPRLPPLVEPRRRLVELLDQASGSPLTIVRAPGGGGKTALLAGWARERARAGYWVTVDSAWSSRLAFWQHVIGIGIDTGSIPGDSLLADLVMSDHVEPVLRSSLARGFAAIGEPILVVVDDYQYVTDAAVHDDIHHILTGETPLRMLLATRSRSELEDPRWTARLGTTIIGPGDLLLDREEIADAAGRAGYADAATRLADALGGWPLATQGALVELAAGRARDVEDAIARVGGGGLDRLLADFDGSPYLGVLLRTSIATRFTARLAVELAGSEAMTHLERAEREGLGTWDPSGTPPTFSYQPVLRAALETELLRRFPGEVAGLRRSYAAERDAADDPITAMRQYAALDDWDAVAGVVRRHYVQITRVFPAEMRQILEGARRSDLGRHPVLLVLLAIQRNADARTRTDAILDLAQLAIAAGKARVGLGNPVDRLWVRSAMLGAQRLGGQYDQALETARGILDQIDRLGPDERHEVRDLLPTLLFQAATTFNFVGQQTHALALRSDIDRALRSGGTAWTQMHAESLEQIILATRGEHDALEPRLETMRLRTRPHGWRGTYPATGYHLAEAYLALESFDAPAALRQLDELARHEPTIEEWPMIARVRGLAALVAGDAFAGLGRLSRDIAAHDHRPRTSRAMAAMLALTRVDLLLATGEPHRARRSLEGSRHDPVLALGASRVFLALGQTDRAIAAASPIAWAEQLVPRAQSEAFLVLAIAARRAGRVDDARLAVERAVALLDGHHLRRPLAMVPHEELREILAMTGIDVDAYISDVPSVMPPFVSAASLTERELAVLAGLEHHARVEDLAASLYVSPNTVKTQLRSIYRKLRVSSREEALSVAHLRGLLDGDDAP